MDQSALLLRSVDFAPQKHDSGSIFAQDTEMVAFS